MDGRLRRIFIERLHELNERYREEKYPNVKIKEHFPDKTLKQISEKRRTLRGGGVLLGWLTAGWLAGARPPRGGGCGGTGDQDLRTDK